MAVIVSPFVNPSSEFALSDEGLMLEASALHQTLQLKTHHNNLCDQNPYSAHSPTHKKQVLSKLVLQYDCNNPHTFKIVCLKCNTAHGLHVVLSISPWLL